MKNSRRHLVLILLIILDNFVGHYSTLGMTRKKVSNSKDNFKRSQIKFLDSSTPPKDVAHLATILVTREHDGVNYTQSKFTLMEATPKEKKKDNIYDILDHEDNSKQQSDDSKDHEQRWEGQSSNKGHFWDEQLDGHRRRRVHRIHHIYYNDVTLVSMQTVIGVLATAAMVFYFIQVYAVVTNSTPLTFRSLGEGLSNMTDPGSDFMTMLNFMKEVSMAIE